MSIKRLMQDAARKGSERPDETEPLTLRLRAADVQKGDRIYVRGDWWKIIGVVLAEKYITLTAESSDGKFSSSRTLGLDDPMGVVRDTEGRIENLKAAHGAAQEILGVAERELQEALDLLGELLAMKEKGLGHDDLWRRCAVILRKHGHLTEGDSQQ